MPAHVIIHCIGGIAFLTVVVSPLFKNLKFTINDTGLQYHQCQSDFE